MTLEQDLQALRSRLPPLPPAAPRPALVVLVGLPGTGKSHFAAQLAALFPLATVESDVMRKALFPRPTYTLDESARVFAAIHALLRELLAHRVPTLLDATNLVEANRQVLYRIAEEADASLVLVRLTAPESAVRMRLQARFSSGSARMSSDADWSVYERLRREDEPIQRRHLVVDSSGDIQPALARIARVLEQSPQPGGASRRRE